MSELMQSHQQTDLQGSFDFRRMQLIVVLNELITVLFNNQMQHSFLVCFFSQLLSQMNERVERTALESVQQTLKLLYPQSSLHSYKKKKIEVMSVIFLCFISSILL